MNRRKAKKAVKKKWRIKKWIGNIEPRKMNALCGYAFECLKQAIDRAILYGDAISYGDNENGNIPIGLINDERTVAK